MQSFISGVDTLYDAIIAFSVRVVRGYVYAGDTEQTKAEYTDAYVAEQLEISSDNIEESKTESVADSHVTISDAVKIPLTRGMVMYVGVDSVPVYKNPTIEFDGQVDSIPFGAMVIAGDPQGRFCRVTCGNVSGWVLRDDLADRATNIYPSFTKGSENLVDDTNTTCVRALIQDTFGLSRSEFPLQAGEYVLYRLWKRGLRIAWPSNVHPRVPGAWHTILKGAEGIHITMEPKVGSIIEYMIDDDIGHVAYVEAVFPSGMVTISEVNYPDMGIYGEREISKEDLKELKPLFIEVR